MPVQLHPFYRKPFHASLCLCSVAEAAYEQIISLPMFSGMTDYNVDYALNTIIFDEQQLNIVEEHEEKNLRNYTGQNDINTPSRESLDGN